jgi:mannose-6-phosphate isomerase-like protein (cupin superfamily)
VWLATAGGAPAAPHRAPADPAMLMLLSSARMRLANAPSLPLLPCALAASLAVSFVLAVLRARSGGGGAAPPASASIFDSPDVTRAPPGALAANVSSSHEDARGAYTRVVFAAAAGAPYANVVYSRAGAFRSGDVHKCDQVNLVVSGGATLWTLEAGGRKRSRLVRAGELVVTPAGVPHLFRFTADSVLTEHWVHGDGSLCAYEAWFYKPFRDKVDASVAAGAAGAAVAGTAPAARPPVGAG